MLLTIVLERLILKHKLTFNCTLELAFDIQNKVKEPFSLEGDRGINCETSIRVAYCLETATSFRKLFASADNVLRENEKR